MLSELLNPPGEETAAAIFKSAGEDPGRLQHGLHLLEKWMACQNHLPKNYDKNLLVVFLRGCKHDLERAKRKLECYFVFTTYHADILRNRIPSIQHDLKASSYVDIVPMPELTPQGYRITVFRLSNGDPSVFKMLDSLRYSFILCDIRLHKDNVSTEDVYIFDGDRFSPAHATKFVTPHFKVAADFVQKAIPRRIKQVHVITSQAIVLNVVGLVKQLLPDKLKKRFYIHKTCDSLFEYVSPKLLPSDYGGAKSSCEQITKEWREAVADMGQWLARLEDVKVNGPVPKHLESSCSTAGFGAEGSFRRLNID